MFCKYCGKKLDEGELCQCPKARQLRQSQHIPQNQMEAPQLKPINRQEQWQKQRQEQWQDNYQSRPPQVQPPAPGHGSDGYSNGNNGNKKSHKGLIIGLIIAGVVLVAAAAAAVVILLHGRDKKTTPREDAKVQSESVDSEVSGESESESKPESESEAQKDSAIAKLKKDYEDGKADYVQVKKSLNALDADSISASDADLVIVLQDKIGADLKGKIDALVKESKYTEAFSTMTAILEKLPEDKLTTDLKDKYEIDYILYLESESRRLVREDKKEAAIQLLTEAKAYVSDKALVDDLIANVQKDDEYIIADSNSRYLTNDDVKNLSLREINYAKNEIYARHGRRFASKELQDYFNSKSWYNGTIEPNNFSASVFNKYEKANADFLSDVEFSIDSAGYKLDAK